MHKSVYRAASIVLVALVVSACGVKLVGEPVPCEEAALTTARAYIQRGDASAGDQTYECAIRDYTRAIALQPDNAEAYNNRGYARYWSGQAALAIADYDHAIALRPAYAYAYNNRGAANMASGQSARAIADFDRAIELQPDLAQAYTNRGNAYLRLGRLEQARADFRHGGKDPFNLLTGICLSAIVLGGLLILLVRRRAARPAERHPSRER